jgi:hypothetical protein
VSSTRAATLEELLPWTAAVQGAHLGEGSGVSDMLFRGEGFLKPPEAIPPPFCDAMQPQDNVSLSFFQSQVWPNGLHNGSCLLASNRPQPRLFPPWAKLPPPVDIASQFFMEPVQKVAVSIANLECGRDVDFLSQSKADTAFAVNDPGQVSEINNVHALIIPQSQNKGTIKGTHRKRKKH